MKKDRTISVEQCWTQTLKFFVHFIELAVHFSCNSFARIQEIVMNQTQTTKLSLWSSFDEILALENVVEFRRDLVNESIVADYYKESIFHRTLQFFRENKSFLLRKRRADDISKQWFFLCSFNLVAAPNQASNLSSFFVFPIFLNGYKLLYALHSIQKQTSERLYEDWL